MATVPAAEATEEEIGATRALAEELIYPEEPAPALRRMVRALERVEYLAGHVANAEGTPPMPLVLAVEAGEVIPADSPVVQARPHSFTPEAA